MTTVTLNLEIPDHLKGHELLLGRPDSSQGDWKWNGDYGEWVKALNFPHCYQTLILRPRPAPVLHRWCPYCPSEAIRGEGRWMCWSCWSEARDWFYTSSHPPLPDIQTSSSHPPLLPKPWAEPARDGREQLEALAERARSPRPAQVLSQPLPHASATPTPKINTPAKAATPGTCETCHGGDCQRCVPKDGGGRTNWTLKPAVPLEPAAMTNHQHRKWVEGRLDLEAVASRQQRDQITELRSAVEALQNRAEVKP